MRAKLPHFPGLSTASPGQTRMTKNEMAGVQAPCHLVVRSIEGNVCRCRTDELLPHRLVESLVRLFRFLVGDPFLFRRRLFPFLRRLDGAFGAARRFSRL